MPVFQPTARIFLSVDLVGSTAHKGAPKLPLSHDADHSWGTSGLTPPWLSAISDFYSQFAQIFEEEWKKFELFTDSNPPLTCGKAPELWKANGDELIYVKEINDRREVHGCVWAWANAIQEYREELKKQGRLDLKGTVWFAGFPVLNSEIVFADPGLEAQEHAFPDDSRLRQLGLRDLWERQPEMRRHLKRDFIGPSIDAGFRLASLATPRKLILSIDIAYLLSTAVLPPEMTTDSDFGLFEFRYDGRMSLKGVLNGKPYPVFWVDILRHDRLTSVEDKLSVAPVLNNAQTVKEFCEEFYNGHADQLFRPFIKQENEQQFPKIPENYDGFIQSLEERWESEKQRYELENSVGDETTGSGLTDEDVVSRLNSELGSAGDQSP